MEIALFMLNCKKVCHTDHKNSDQWRFKWETNHHNITFANNKLKDILRDWLIIAELIHNKNY